MEQFTGNTLQILFFLMPGFLASLIMESLIIRKEKNQFNLIIEALIFSIIIYFIYISFKNIIIFIINIFSIVQIQFLTNIFQLKIEYIDLFFLFIISIFLGFISGIGIYKDWFLKPLRKKELTKKTSRASVWLDAFYQHNKNRPVVIYFLNGTRIHGLIKHFSDNAEYPYLYLISPAWVIYNKKNKKTEFRPLEGTSGILITPEEKIKFIEFRK